MMIATGLLFSLNFLGIIFSTFPGCEARYKPTWDSLGTRPLPRWFDEAKFGIMLHWGVYSVPSYGTDSEWFWAYGRMQSKLIKENYPPNFTYQDFASQFKAEFFNPNQWADLFKESGAQYVTLTSKHHEGYCLWPSPRSYSWNSMDVGPKRDIIGDVAKAVRMKGLHFGVYYSLYEWFNPIYRSDKKANLTTNEYVKHKMYPEMVNLVQRYKPEIWWSDGDWEAKDVYWKSTKFIAWLYNDSPVKDTIVVNNRWGHGVPCGHGDFCSGGDNFDPGHLLPYKWESPTTANKNSWGYRRDANLQDYHTIEFLVHKLIRTVSCGGNFALNVGPTGDGRIDIIFQERLHQIGQWLKINGEAIYSSNPWVYQNDTVAKINWYTSKPDAIYAMTYAWPVHNKLELRSIFNSVKNGSINAITLLGSLGNLKYTFSTNSVVIQLPDKATVKSEWAWTLKFHKTEVDCSNQIN